MRTSLHALLLLALAAPLAAQTGERTFVIRLGRDTFGIERFTRGATTLEGDLLFRTPGSVPRHYVVTFDSTGRMTGYQFGVRDSLRTVNVSDPRALPYLFLSAGVTEELTRHARATPQPVDTMTVVAPSGAVQQLIATDAGDSMAVVLEGDTAPFMLAVARDGTVLGISGLRTTDKEVSEPAPLDFPALAQAFATRPLGAASPADSVLAAVGGVAVRVDYSRPSLRGRTAVGGLLVPWNQVWRTGANAATRFTTSGDLVVGGHQLPAGTYTLFTLPSPAGWTLIISKETRAPGNPRRPLWGTDYNPDSDLVRLPMRVETLPDPVERFTIGVTPKASGGTLWLSWEKTRVSVLLAKR
ncbi:MAG TPA: DUF2911 domain-containing protein [Gemmatimonadales bacterium]|nr:DUF2911 domain-containing protein [Gemmatimonadales bacterium]